MRSTKVFKCPTNCTCGKPAIVSALDTHASDNAEVRDLLGIFCTDCAAQGIRSLPPCSWLHIVALSRSTKGSKSSIRRKYKVYSLNERANRASIVVLDGSNQFLCGLRFVTRLDGIPKNFRTVDATFEIRGKPLEIDLFENSTQP